MGSEKTLDGRTRRNREDPHLENPLIEPVLQWPLEGEPLLLLLLLLPLLLRRRRRGPRVGPRTRPCVVRIELQVGAGGMRDRGKGASAGLMGTSDLRGGEEELAGQQQTSRQSRGTPVRRTRDHGGGGGHGGPASSPNHADFVCGGDFNPSSASKTLATEI